MIGVTHPIPEPLRTFDPLATALSADLQRIDALHARYRQSRDQGRILPNATEAIRIELTYNSNAIEGNTLSLRDTQLVIEGGVPPAGKSMREIYEARNHDRALRTLEGWAANRPASSPITDQDLLAVHAHVLADIDPAAAGRLRTDRVLIAGSRFIPPARQKFDTLLPALLHLANRPGLHPVLLAAQLHYNLVAVHPFNDGNGRTARLMMNYALLRCAYPLAVIEVAGRAEYMAALDEANSGRCERFARVVTSSVERSVHRLLGSDQ